MNEEKFRWISVELDITDLDDTHGELLKDAFVKAGEDAIRRAALEGISTDASTERDDSDE